MKVLHGFNMIQIVLCVCNFIMFISVSSRLVLQLLWVDLLVNNTHDDVIKLKHFPRYWPFVQGIDRSPLNSLHKGQWRKALMFSLIWAWMNGWVNNHEAGDLRCPLCPLWHHSNVHIWSVEYCQKPWIYNNELNFQIVRYALWYFHFRYCRLKNYSSTGISISIS